MSCCRIHCAIRSSLIDRELNSIDRKSGRMFFLQNFQLSPKPIWRVGFFVCPRYKRETLATFLRLLYFAVCVNLLWDLRGGCLHTCLGLSRRRFHWELNDHSIAALERLKIHKWECLYLLGIQERSSPWTRSCHVVVVVSFLLEVAIGC